MDLVITQITLYYNKLNCIWLKLIRLSKKRNSVQNQLQVFYKLITHIYQIMKWRIFYKEVQKMLDRFELSIEMI